jgi:hypothetical protein
VERQVPDAGGLLGAHPVFKQGGVMPRWMDSGVGLRPLSE